MYVNKQKEKKGLEYTIEWFYIKDLHRERNNY